MTRYEHTQIGHFVIWALLGGAVVTVTIGATVSPPWIHFVIAAILLLAVAGFYKLTIKIDNESVIASFGPGLIKKETRLTEIIACEPIRIRWWYGWGIHLTPYGWLYNISGWDAVTITLRDGRRFSLGTDDPHGLTAAILRFASAR